jgi:hypothetical protein
MRKPLTFAVASMAGAALVASCSSSKTAGVGSAVSPTSTSSASTTSGGVDSAALKQKVLAAMQAARQFRVTGDTTDDEGVRLTFDIHFGPHQTAGSITQAEVGKIELINPGGPSLYFKAPDALWRKEGGDAAVALLHDRWVKVPANDKRFDDFAKAFDKDSFLAELTSGASGSEEIRKVGTTTIDGKLAVQYESISDHTRMFVAASGPPVLLKMVNAGTDGGTVTFSDYDKAYAFTPPPANETVDFAKLEQASR